MATQARSAARRQAILDAALACFDDIGFELASIQMIRERSGASVGSIYHHFTDKDGIATALYLQGIRAYQEAMLEVLGEDTEAGIRGLVTRHLDWARDHAALARFMESKPPAAHAGLREANRAYFARVKDWLQPRIERGELRDMPLELYLPLLIGPAQMHLRSLLAGRATLPAADAGRHLADAAWAALSGTGARLGSGAPRR